MPLSPSTTAAQKTNYLSRIALSLTTGLVLFTASTQSATAEDRFEKSYAPRYVASDTRFREAHPIRVYVTIGETRQERHAGERRRGHRGNGKLRPPQTLQTLNQLGNQLPDYVRIVHSPDDADLVIRVRETDYNLDFRVLDVDRKDKKYKKGRRYSPGRCGVHHKAYFNKVKEKGEAYATYSLRVNLKGIGRDQNQFTLRADKKYNYGTDLRAATNCGMRPTNRMPSNDVAELFARSNKNYRHYVAREIREEAVGKLSLRIAHRIRQQSDYFYGDLATRLRYGNYTERDSNGDQLKHDFFGLLFDLAREASRDETMREHRKSQSPHPRGGYGR